MDRDMETVEKLKREGDIKMKVFVINGYPGAGKDTFVNYCKDFYPQTINIITSQPVQNIFKDLGWEGAKTPEIRKALAELKEDTDELFDTSFRYVKNNIEWMEDDHIYKYSVFIHCREPKNIKRYVEAYEAKAIFIASDRHDKITNPSDRDVANYKYDIVIDNNGTLDELREKAREFVNVYVKEEEQ